MPRPGEASLQDRCRVGLRLRLSQGGRADATWGALGQAQWSSEPAGDCPSEPGRVAAGHGEPQERRTSGIFVQAGVGSSGGAMGLLSRAWSGFTLGTQAPPALLPRRVWGQGEKRQKLGTVRRGRRDVTGGSGLAPVAVGTEIGVCSPAPSRPQEPGRAVLGMWGGWGRGGVLRWPGSAPLGHMARCKEPCSSLLQEAGVGTKCVRAPACICI